MEIRLTGIHVSESTMFKIDLIVWKSTSGESTGATIQEV